jgi:hypothetical protein
MEEESMAYEAPIQRSDPTVFLFLVDQSGSMSDKMASSERTKAQFVADALNRTLMNLVVRCTKSEGVRDYFTIGVVGYGNNGAENGLRGSLSTNILNSISSVEAHPIRVEDRKRKTDDGAGGVVEQTVKFPVWFESTSHGGTPMCAALTRGAEELAAWCDAHPNCYPPTVLHVTDGESTDGDPENAANAIRQFHTHDGNVLLLNLHVSSHAGTPIRFPSVEAGLPDRYAQMLFRMSSVLPEHLVRAVNERGNIATANSRGYIFNADAAEIVDFFDIGTRATQLR